MIKRALPLLLLTGCAGPDLGAIVSLEDLPSTLERLSAAVLLVTPGSTRPVECVLGRLASDTLAGAGAAIRFDGGALEAPTIGVSFGSCLLGAELEPLPCETHRALVLATGYAAQLPGAVVGGLLGEPSTLGGFALPDCAAESVPNTEQPTTDEPETSSESTTDEVG